MSDGAATFSQASGSREWAWYGTALTILQPKRHRRTLRWAARVSGSFIAFQAAAAGKLVGEAGRDEMIDDAPQVIVRRSTARPVRA